MIRFSAFLVVVAVGLLVAGVVTSKLLLVYIAIGVSGVALLALGAGAAVNWRELTGKAKTTADRTSAQGPAPAPQQEAPAPQAQAPPSPAADPQVVPALAGTTPKLSATAAAGAVPSGTVPSGVAPAGSGWPVIAPTSPARSGHLPADQPRPQPPWATPAPVQPAAFTARPQATEPVPSAKDQLPAKDTWFAKSARPVQDRPPQEAESPAHSPSTETRPAPVVEPEPATETRPAPVVEPEPAAETRPAPVVQPEQADPPAGTEPSGLDLNLEVTVVPGVPRYHNATCILIRFMGEGDLEKMTRGAAREAGCTPCRACLPDQPDKAPE